MPDNIILISDPKVFAIPINDNNEPLVAFSNQPRIFLSDKKTKVTVVDNDNINTINPHFAKIRKTVYKKIIQSLEFLPEGINYLFEEGWRPISIQKEIYDWYYNKLRNNHPSFSKEKLLIETSKYVSPYDNTPAHSTGGAFDISLCDGKGNELEMGSNSDDPPELNEGRGYTYADNISDIAKMNRQVLISAMTKVGFINYPAEWWHWSYGDRYWAFHAQQPCAIYASVKEIELVE